MFTSHEKDRKKAYAEFIRSKRKEDAPDIHRTQHPSLFGPYADAYKKEFGDKNMSDVVAKKRKTLLPCE